MSAGTWTGECAFATNLLRDHIRTNKVALSELCDIYLAGKRAGVSPIHRENICVFALHNEEYHFLFHEEEHNVAGC